MESEKRYFKLKTLSPVHTGMSSEKDWAPGLDFIQTNSHILVFRQKDLLNALFEEHGSHELAAFTQLLADGNAKSISEFLVNKKLLNPKFIEWSIPYSGDDIRDPIKRVFTNGMGIPTMPGSGIKGAIRSVIGNRILRDKKVKVWDDKELFGDISSNLMQLLQVADVPFVNTSFARLKTFSGDGHPDENPMGQWKDRKDGGHSTRFKPEGFVSYYQVFEEGYESGLAINFPAKLPNANRPFQEYLKPDTLLEHIQAYNKSYIKKELEYLKTFENELTDQVQDFYQDLLERVLECKSTFLRIGAAVGYHSISGDWRYANHMIWKEGRPEFEREDKRKQIHAKTRKFAFDYPQKELQLLPLGWIELKPCNEQEYLKALDQHRELPQVQLEAESVESIVIPATPVEAPVMFTGKLKVGLKLRAKKLEVKDKAVKVSLYVTGLEDQAFTFTYGNPALLKDEFFVQINSLAKDKIQSISYVGPLV